MFPPLILKKYASPVTVINKAKWKRLQILINFMLN